MITVLMHSFIFFQFYQNSAALIIAETLQTHLFAQSEFLKHLIQETLFSLAQNGSLLGKVKNGLCLSIPFKIY